MKILKRMLHPKPWIILVCVILTALSMFYVFGLDHEGEPLAYAAYLFSAYSLVVSFIWLGNTLGKILLTRLDQNESFHRYRTDIPFRTRTNLMMGVCINLLYALMKFGMGMYYRSVWFVTLSVYYCFLTAMRYSLLRNTAAETLGQDSGREYKKYRGCGIILLLMNFALMGIIVLVLYQNQSFHYAGFLIYAIAAYTFYYVISAVINVARYRKYGSPVMSATRVVSMAAALVSVLSLQVALLTEFGSADDPFFHRVMVGATGGCISLILVITGVYMIRNANKQLNA